MSCATLIRLAMIKTTNHLPLYSSAITPTGRRRPPRLRLNRKQSKKMEKVFLLLFLESAARRMSLKGTLAAGMSTQQTLLAETKRPHH